MLSLLYNIIVPEASIMFHYHHVTINYGVILNPNSKSKRNENENKMKTK